VRLKSEKGRGSDQWMGRGSLLAIYNTGCVGGIQGWEFGRGVHAASREQCFCISGIIAFSLIIVLYMMVTRCEEERIGDFSLCAFDKEVSWWLERDGIVELKTKRCICIALKQAVLRNWSHVFHSFSAKYMAFGVVRR
jgi:hypothetical protein